MRLYTTPMSANGRKVHATARHLGLDVGLTDVNVYRGEGQAPAFTAVNPAGKVPVLQDGALTLTESNAILVYLAEAHGEDRLWSTDVRQRASILRWLFWEAAHWQPTLTAALADHAGHIMLREHVAAPNGDPRWDAPALAAVLKAVESQLQDTPFLAGPMLSLADFSVAGMTIFLQRLGFPFADYPALERWFRAMHQLPAWREINTAPWTCTLAP